MPKSTQLGQKNAAITTTLSLRLLRSDKTVEQAIRDTSAVAEVESDSGRLFAAQAPPTWLRVVNQFSKQGDLKLENKSCAASCMTTCSKAGSALSARTASPQRKTPATVSGTRWADMLPQPGPWPSAPSPRPQAMTKMQPASSWTAATAGTLPTKCITHSLTAKLCPRP